jgi:hypothetical protein
MDGDGKCTQINIKQFTPRRDRRPCIIAEHSGKQCRRLQEPGVDVERYVGVGESGGKAWRTHIVSQGSTTVDKIAAV